MKRAKISRKNQPHNNGEPRTLLAACLGQHFFSFRFLLLGAHIAWPNQNAATEAPPKAVLRTSTTRLKHIASCTSMTQLCQSNQKLQQYRVKQQEEGAGPLLPRREERKGEKKRNVGQGMRQAMYEVHHCCAAGSCVKSWLSSSLAH